MTIDEKIIDQKLQYNINKKASEISALSSVNFEKYEYLTAEKILPYKKKKEKLNLIIPHSDKRLKTQKSN